MRIIEINALSNGAHHNQSIDGDMTIPAGWAIVPEGMELENFPFGEVTAEEIGGVMTATGWTPGVMPEPESAEEPAGALTDAELAEALLSGINDI